MTIEYDNMRSHRKEAEAEQDRLVTKEVLEEFDKLLREYLEANPGRKDDVPALVSKYAKGGIQILVFKTDRKGGGNP